MNYGFIAIPDAEVPLALEPVFQHVVTTYASEANKTVSVWRAKHRCQCGPFGQIDTCGMTGHTLALSHPGHGPIIQIFQGLLDTCFIKFRFRLVGRGGRNFNCA